MSKPRSRWRATGALPIVLFLAGCLLFARSALVSASEAASGSGVVEEVRVTSNADYVLERHIFFAAGAEDTAATADAVAGTSSTSTGGASAAFVINNHLWAASALPVVVHYNSADQPIGLATTSTIIQTEIQTWTSAGASFAFAYGGSTAASASACEGAVGNIDGSNTIAFVTTLPAAVLGQTCTIATKGGAKSSLVEFDMQVAIDVPWAAGQTNPKNSYDLPSTLLHELGHAAGLGHSSVRSAVMYASLANGEQKRVLMADDIGAINAAYPPPPGAGPTPTPIPTPTTAPTPVYDKNYIIKAPAVARD